MQSEPSMILDTGIGIGAGVAPRARKRAIAARYFWFGLALFFVLVAALGFASSYVDAAKGTLEIPPIVHVHGALMIAWLLLFVVQTGLAAFGALKWHRTLGMTAVGLAAALWISMGVVTANSLVRHSIEEVPWIYDITLAALTGLVVWPLLFIWGIRVRRNAGAHKRLLAFSTLFLLQAAVDRIQWLPEFPLPGFWSHAIRLYPLMIPIFVFDFASLKRIHPMTIVATGIVGANHAFISHFWGNPGWHHLMEATAGFLRQSTR